MSQTILFNNIDPTQWVYHEPVDSRGRGKTVFIDRSGDDRRNPSFQLNKCRVPFGASPGLEARPENTRWNLELSIDDSEMQEFFKKLDAHTLDWLGKNSQACLGREMRREVIAEAGTYRTVLQHNNPNFAPVCRTKIIIGRGAEVNGHKPKNKMTNILVVTKEENGVVTEFMPGTKEDLTRNCTVVAKVEVGGMWFVTGKCGMSLVATDILVWPAEKEEEFPFNFGSEAARPTKVDRRTTFHPFDMEQTAINMPPVTDSAKTDGVSTVADAIPELIATGDGSSDMDTN